MNQLIRAPIKDRVVRARVLSSMTLGVLIPADVGLVVAIGQVLETDVAQAVSWAPKHRLVVAATEADVAQAVTSLKSRAVGLAVEADLAQALTARKTLAVGHATETDLAQGLATRKALAVGQAVETDLGQAVTARKAQALGQAVETDLAQAVAVAPMRRLIGAALETDLAQAVTPILTAPVGDTGRESNVSRITMLTVIW